MPDARRERSRFNALLDSIRRLLGIKPPQLPGDPYADRMAPVRRGPKGRSGAAAVAEPEEDSHRAFPPRAR
jgi:hypothetical protein